MRLKKRDKVVLAVVALWFFTRDKKTAAASDPRPLTTPQSTIVDPATGRETPVQHSSIEVKSTDPNPSGPPASADFSATSD